MSYLEFNGTCSISTSTGQYKTRSTDVNGKKKVIIEVDDGAQIYEFDGEANANVISKTSSTLPACGEDSKSSTHKVNESGNLVCKDRDNLKTPPSYGPLLLTFTNFIFYNVSLAFVFIYLYYWNDPKKILMFKTKAKGTEKVFWEYFTLPSLCFGIATFLSLILQVDYLRRQKKNVDNDDNFIFDCEKNAFNSDYDTLLGITIVVTVLGMLTIIIPPIYYLVKKRQGSKTSTDAADAADAAMRDPVP